MNRHERRAQWQASHRQAAAMPVRGDRLLGNRIWHPIYEAMVEHDLVMGIHWGGTSEGAPSVMGWASWYVEEYAAEWHAFEAQILSLIAEGVFQACPSLRVSVLEGGFTWVPQLLWRMDSSWKALRTEIPWVNRRPSDLMHEHVRFSTAPLDAGTSEEMAHIVEWFDADDCLMFASDYPHMHDDDVAGFLSAVSPVQRSAIMADTARKWYGLG